MKRIFIIVLTALYLSTGGVTRVAWAQTLDSDVIDTEGGQATLRAAPSGELSELPAFEVDPSWPQLPSQWVLGLVSGVAVDAADHVWVLHRPATVSPEQQAMAAPAVLEFDASGTFIQAWGGPGLGYEWPSTPHGIAVDSQGCVWIGGSGRGDHQLLKFTKTGTFALQIGRAGQSQGNTDTDNVNRAADVELYEGTNEIFVADGYGNRRVIVFDADTGAFKRMWGAFGNVPEDPKPGEILTSQDDEGDGPQQFNGVHSVRVSKDGLVYVSDRDNQRVQVFGLDGTYMKQVFISRGTMAPSTAAGVVLGRPRNEVEDALLQRASTASRTAFSADPEQRFLYVIDRRYQQIVILDRQTIEFLGSFGGGIGREPGQFFILHDLAADSNGNVYTTEVNGNGNRRAQKFVFKGMSLVTSR